MVWHINFGERARDVLKTEPEQSEVLRYLNRQIAASDDPRRFGYRKKDIWTYKTNGIAIDVQIEDETSMIMVLDVRLPDKT